MSTINEPYTLPSGLTLKNRLVKAATTEGLADGDGSVSTGLTRLYETWGSESDLGLIITGNVQVDRRFLERVGNVCIDLDFGEQTSEQLEKLSALTTAAKANGTKIICQISHGGRQSSTKVAVKALGPSAVQHKAKLMGPIPVEEMSKEQIERVVEKFVYAATITKQAGFDGAQIHSAHGYLLSSFLNPNANKRTDSYGGSLENRASLLLEIVGKVRAATGKDFTLAVKLNSSDFQKGGFTLEESAKVASMLASAGIDLLELSGGTYESPAFLGTSTATEKKAKTTVAREAHFLEFAEKISETLKADNLDLPIVVTGGFRTRAGMDAALKSKATDLIGIASPLCADPGCTKRLLAGEIERLPNIPGAWKLPSVLGWSFLRRFKMISDLSHLLPVMQFYENFRAIGRGDFVPQTEKSYPNLLKAATAAGKSEQKAIKELTGYNMDDPYVKDKF